jgi:tetratricopeptide (TPR) repeat protein
MIELISLIEFIISVTSSAKGALERKECVIKVLKKFDLDPEHPPAYFSGVYAYTLVEYGVGKEKPILELFRQQEIKDAFRKAFEQSSLSILTKEAENILQWSKTGDQIRELGIDPHLELVEFARIFSSVADRTRTPAEVKQDHKLDNIDSTVRELKNRMDSLLELVENNKIAKPKAEKFLPVKASIEDSEEEKTEREEIHVEVSSQQSGQLAEADFMKVDEINKEIDEAVKFIEANDIEEAKTHLFLILGKIKDKPVECAYELARVYNNLGVCFNRLKTQGGDFEKAEEYFKSSLKAKGDFSKAKANLASVYLNKGGVDNYKKAYGIAQPLWQESDKKDPLFLQILIWTTYHHKSVNDAIEYYENSEEAKALVGSHAELLNLMATMYSEKPDFDIAIELIDRAIELQPNAPQHLSTKARILMSRSVKQNIIRSVFEVVPKFRDYKDIEEALKLLEQAQEAIKIVKNPVLEELIKADIFSCSLWLRRADEAKFRDIRKSIHVEQLDPVKQQQLRIGDFDLELRLRNFETAFKILVESPDWAKIHYGEKARIARMFFLHGAPEQSKNILQQLESDAEQKRDIQYWLDIAQNEILIDNKHLAIKALERAKSLAVGTPNEKIVLSNYNAVMLRYAWLGESDRLTEGLFETQKRYPDEKIITPVRGLDKNGKLTDEIKSFLLQQKEWYEGVKHTFRSQPVPTYFLEEIFKRPYADILSRTRQNDSEFIIELTTPNPQFEAELLSNLQQSQAMIFDYAALLNLSKMNLLGHFAKFNKRICIAQELFDKIQEELLSFEHEDLRRLWQFLRTSKEIEIVEDRPGLSESVDVSDLLGKWIVASMRLAKSINAVFVADDLRFLLFLKNENIKGCNTPILLKFMLATEWIDSKIYSTSLGDLAERCYVFLSYTGEDLYRIVMEDKCKITFRSYHLVNQLLLPGSNVGSFIAVFVKFVDLLWKTGSLPDDKVNWLGLLSKKLCEFIEKEKLEQQPERLKNIINSLLMMWSIAIQTSNKDELPLLQDKASELITKTYLTDLKLSINVLLERRKDQLK